MLLERSEKIEKKYAKEVQTKKGRRTLSPYAGLIKKMYI